MRKKIISFGFLQFHLFPLCLFVSFLAEYVSFSLARPLLAYPTRHGLTPTSGTFLDFNTTDTKPPLHRAHQTHKRTHKHQVKMYESLLLSLVFIHLFTKRPCNLSSRLSLKSLKRYKRQTFQKMYLFFWDGFLVYIYICASECRCIDLVPRRYIFH